MEQAIIWVFLSVAAGGVLKGATGAGAPLVAVPVITMQYGVQFAITVFVIPSLVSNMWQGWAYRRDLIKGPLPWVLSAAGVLGIVAGSWLLVWLRAETLSVIVAAGVLVYVGLRLLRMDMVLSRTMALRWSFPVGLVAGLLQGTSGISAPATLTYLNALRIGRSAFIAIVSVFFMTMTAAQIPALFALGLLTGERLLISSAALVVIAVFMPVGAWIGRRLSTQVFDRVILVLLVALAVRILFDTFIG